MACEESKINRYGAKFFIGQLVRVIRTDRCFSSDIGKVGLINAIDGSLESGFEYSLGATDASVCAWYDEDKLDFVSKEEKDEWKENGKRFRKMIAKTKQGE